MAQTIAKYTVTPRPDASVPAEERLVLSDLMASRAQTYGMLARLFRIEVDYPTMREMQGLRFPVATGNDLVNLGYRQLYDFLKTAWEESVTWPSITCAASSGTA